MESGWGAGWMHVHDPCPRRRTACSGSRDFSRSCSRPALTPAPALTMLRRADEPFRDLLHALEHDFGREGAEDVEPGGAPADGAERDARRARRVQVADLVADADGLRRRGCRSARSTFRILGCLPSRLAPHCQSRTSAAFRGPSTWRTFAAELLVTMATRTPASASRRSISSTPGKSAMRSMSIAIRDRMWRMIRGIFHAATPRCRFMRRTSYPRSVSSSCSSMRRKPNRSAHSFRAPMNQGNESASVPSKSKMASLYLICRSGK